MTTSLQEQPALLPITIDGHTFAPNADGLWNLNAIHKGLSLLTTKRPSQWDNEIRSVLDQSGNFHTALGGANPGTWATEAGTIAYAMWVSPDFYLMVIHAFIAMRNNAVTELRHKDALLDANMPKASALDLKARGAGLTWSEACHVVGIKNPRLAMDALVSMKSFVYPVDSLGDREGSPRPKDQGFAVGAFVKASREFGNKEGWRVKPRGLDWLKERAQVINDAVAETRRKKAQGKRAAQRAQVDRWGRTNKLQP